MKNKNRYFFLFLFSFCLLCQALPVFAEESCTTSEKNRLRSLAANVQFVYEINKDEEFHTHFFSITATNLNKEFYVHETTFNGMFTYDETREDPKTVTDAPYAGGYTYHFEVIANDTSSCPGEVLVTRNFQIPRYNVYSEREECKGIEEFALCQKYYALDITEEAFLRKVEEYKKSLEEKKDPVVPDDKETKNIWLRFIDFYLDNIVYSVAATVLVIGGVTVTVVLLVRKRKRKWKL